ncbi:hypothetical protein POM88_016429 [Heracleum sosnowskyi]|uniref:PI3K/PI4K catalytic domain-containing protein n=1 Tax=Heracleum sosnowskyi TaxID=360622 RepID=A0AAD8IMK5_9APIA|nr:hypothetical protein POM88_016429 [Heracleum sosnowskyi]
MSEFYIDIFVQENDNGKAFQEVCKNFRPVVHYFFLERFLHASDWFEKRVAYTRSVEASSMVGYIVGPGDRHSMNILIDQATAEVVHIDLGVAFEQGLMLKTTERVPFRLTRDIVDGMGITGVEGVFRRCCEETLSVMRTKKEALLTIHEIFMHDPLYKWALSPLKALQRQKRFFKHMSTAGVSFKGRARKSVKYQEESDTESEIDSEPEPADSDDEFQICQICNSEAERKKLLQYWSCVSCKEKTEEYLQQRRVYLAQKLERYDEATERKSHILNPLDDVIVQLGGPYKVQEITGRRHRLVRASNGIAVRYEPRSIKDVTMEMVKINEKQSFMDGEKFGRTHRSNHASAPEYRLLFGNLGGERRFASIIAKRLESLGALTQGDSRGPSLRAYNYESPYAKRALAELYNGIVIQSSLLVVPPGCSLEKPNTIEDFIVKGKAALVSVGLVKDDTNVGRILSA